MAEFKRTHTEETIDTFFLPSVEEVKGGYVFFGAKRKE